MVPTRLVLSVSAVLFSLLLAGCSLFQEAPPPFQRGEVLHQTSVLPPPPPFFLLPHGSLTLKKCIQMALQQNPELRALEWKTKGVQKGVLQASSYLWPELKLDLSYTHHLDSQRIVTFRKPGDVGVWSKDILTGAFSLSYPLYTGGRITSQVQSAELLFQSSLKRLYRARKALTFEVTRLFYTILKQQKVLEALQFSRKTLQTHRQNVLNLLASQRATRDDLLRTEARLASLEASIEKTRNYVHILKLSLAKLLGLERPPRCELQGDLEVLPPTVEEQQSFALALEHREDYHALQREILRAKKLLQVAQAGNLPQLALVGRYGANWGVGDIYRQPGAKEVEDFGQISLALSFPLFQGGRVQAAIAQARDRLEELLAQKKALELQIRLEVNQALANLASSQARIKASQKSLRQSRESLRLVQEKYALGKATVVEVLDAQQDLLNAQLSHYQALADYHIGLAQWQLAVGK